MSIEITTALLDGIKARARAASPGPWTKGRDVIGVKTEHGFQRHIVESSWPEDDSQGASDMAHIAGLDPQTVLAVVERLERVEALNTAVERLLRAELSTIGSGLMGIMQSDIEWAQRYRDVRALAAGQPVPSDLEAK